jgi:hypothetical protein
MSSELRTPLIDRTLLPQVLEAFVADLAAAEPSYANGSKTGGAAEGTTTTAAGTTEAAAASAVSVGDFVQRFLKWTKRERKV